MAARFEGTLDLRALAEGRVMELLGGFGFVDDAETAWRVPRGAKVDGASIPRLLWPVIGSPWTGRYRDASVVHDWFCDRRTRTWRDTHRMFFDAMTVSGVDGLQARTMYLAVYWRGPRWSDTVIANNILKGGEKFSMTPKPLPKSDRFEAPEKRGPGEDVSEFAALQRIVEDEALDPAQIDVLVDETTGPTDH